MKKKQIYLDYASTTPLDKKVLKAMMPYLKSEYGNPSSVHVFGQESRVAVENSREQLAKFLNCSANEIIFTSGATEANNLAIQGVVNLAKESPLQQPHIVTSTIEHESVLAPIQELEKQGNLEVTYVAVNKEGIVNPADIEKAIKENTVLISIQYANSEIGTVQPIREIGKIIKNYKLQTKNYKLVFHTDAVQAAQFLDCDVKKLGVDLLTLSSHKVYGPKGVGVLYIKKGIIISSMIYGGGQEQGIRSGTENVAGIVGMGEAIQEIQNPKSKVQNIKMRQLRDKLIKDILKRISSAKLTGSLEYRLCNNTHFLFKGLQGKDIVLLLDQKGIAVSSGSACSELTQESSHVLLSMGYNNEEAHSALRITLGKYTKKEEIEKTVKALEKVVEELREN